MKKNPADYLSLALDNCDNIDLIRNLVGSTSRYISTYKIGLEQYTRFGHSLFKTIREADRKIFLDLKLHDIPNTVAKAVGAATEHGVDYLTIHISGGLKMIEAAAEAAGKVRGAPKIIGVTVLTSVDQGILNNELKVPGSISEHVRRFVFLAIKAGLDGIVCSAEDLPSVKPVLPEGFEIVTPGIRLADNDVHDQKRTATPQKAVSEGATLLVIGRPITQASDPESAAKIFFNEITAALK